MKLIVTGGAGFIGSNLVRGLNAQGYEDIIVVDEFNDSLKHRNLNHVQVSDVLDKDDFLQNLDSFKEVGAIFHQGACSSTTETDGKYMMQTNYEYSKALLHHCLGSKIPFLYASSASVYGDGDHGFEEKRSCEDPLNVYAFSKFAFDNYVRQYLPKAQSLVLGLRYFNVYGPQEMHKGSMASVGFHFFNQYQEGNPIQLFEGSDTFLRDFIYVQDVVDVNLHFLENPQSGIYNCGTGNARSFVDMANVFQSVFPKSKLKYIPFPEHLQNKYQTFTQADLQQLRAAGYSKAFTSLEDGLSEYLRLLERTGGYLK